MKRKEKEVKSRMIPSPEIKKHIRKIFNFVLSGKTLKFMTNQDKQLEEKVIEALKRVHDPEIPVNIYDLGLIYELKIDDQSVVYITMTLTTPNCPIAEDMPGVVYNEVKLVEGVKDVKVELVFDPPWDKDMISEAALLELGLL
jgi:FeS assembly SUF system protein